MRVEFQKHAGLVHEAAPDHPRPNFFCIRRPKVDQPARRAAQSLQDQCFGRSPSTHASLRVVQVGMDDADEAEPSCSARRGGQVIAPDVN